MALRQDNMQEVSDEVPTDVWLHVKVKSATEGKSQKGNDQVTVVFSVQEEPYVGVRYISWISLERSNLARLKKLYAACEYNPGPEGHDPERIVDCDLFIKATKQKNPIEGVPPYQIAEWNMAPLSEGRPTK